MFEMIKKYLKRGSFTLEEEERTGMATLPPLHVTYVGNREKRAFTTMLLLAGYFGFVLVRGPVFGEYTG